MAQKSANTLHVLNGDATARQFQEAKIAGDHLVWREVMVEGPVTEDVKTEAFWAARRQFLEEKYGAPDWQYDRFMEQLAILDNASGYSEVVLWFEYDLFCQINLLAALAYVTHPNISLVCLGDQIDGRLRGLGEIDAEYFPALFRDRQPLTSEDLSYAAEVWGAYTSPDPEHLKTFRQEHSTFSYLDRALQSHFSRFPGRNGINAIEYDMLEIVREGITNERQLIGKMLRNDTWIGLGDLQYIRIRRSLQNLIADDLTLTEKGEEVMDHRAQFEQPAEFIGGVYRPDFFQQTYG